ncbi:hypothetical protein V6Z12_D09G069600 [Gossypium hirsutum]
MIEIGFFIAEMYKGKSIYSAICRVYSRLDPFFSQVRRSWKRHTCTEMRHTQGRAGCRGAAEVVPEAARVSALICAGHWAGVGF